MSLVIPYRVARLEGADERLVPRVTVDAGRQKTLRLGDGPYRLDNDSREELAASDGAARLAWLCELHQRDCDTYDKTMRRWIELYFELISERAAAIDVAGTPVSDALLWGLAAPRPLARAHIPLGETHQQVDIAFWAGGQLWAVVFAGGRRARAGDKLEEAGTAQIIRFDTASLAAGTAALAGPLAPVIADFRAGLTAPPDPFSRSPFRAQTTTRPAF